MIDTAPALAVAALALCVVSLVRSFRTLLGDWGPDAVTGRMVVAAWGETCLAAAVGVLAVATLG